MILEVSLGGSGVTLILNEYVAIYTYGLSSLTVIVAVYIPGSVSLDFGDIIKLGNFPVIKV